METSEIRARPLGFLELNVCGTAETTYLGTRTIVEYSLYVTEESSVDEVFLCDWLARMERKSNPRQPRQVIGGVNRSRQFVELDLHDRFC